MREQILNLLANDNKLVAKDIAFKLKADIKEVELEMKKMEEDEIICGHTSIINWDKTERDFITALIEVRITPQRGDGFDKIAERIYRLPEVKSVYLMSGGFDLTVIIEGKNLKEISSFVSEKLSTIDAVISTATHFILKNYKDNGVILKKTSHEDERMIVSP